MVDAMSCGVAAEHQQVLERLRQLTVWQEAQQERLRAVQQEQIARLRGDLSPGQQPVWGEGVQQEVGVSGVGEREGEGEGGGGRGSVDSGLETGGGRESEDEPYHPHPKPQPQSLLLVGSVADSSEDRPIEPGVCEGDTFEDMLERKLKKHSDSSGRSRQHKPHPFLKRGEGLARFGRVQRSPKARVKPSVKKAPSVGDGECGPAHQSVVGGAVLGSQFSSDESFIIRGSQRVKREEAELVEFEELEKATFNTSSSSHCSLVTTALGGGARGGVSKQSGGDEDLDKTLTPSQTDLGEIDAEPFTPSLPDAGLQVGPSLAAGVTFSDDEEWESFNHETLPTDHTPSSQPRGESSGSPSPWSSPAKHDSSTPFPPSPPHTLTEATPPPHTLTEATPPPSSLTAKLFPVLRQESQQKQPAQQKSVEKKTTPPTATPPRYPSEVRERLVQLESEIERFQRLNSHLEQQAREKEEGLSYLGGEIAEFQHQRKKEMDQFEQYKREEIRKLKKERRVFEMYVLENRASQEKRDREELEGLKSQVVELKEELASSRERWRAALARHRQREESLEAQNRELAADLKMMERERLAWWQEQLERKEDSSSPSPPHASPSHASPPHANNHPHSKPAVSQGPPRKPLASKPTASKPPASKPLAASSPPASKRGKRGRAIGRGDRRPQSEGRKSSPLRRCEGRKSSPLRRCEGRDGDEGVCEEKTPPTTMCEIVEVISRDLSPPQSDLWSGSEASSDVSALADAIVERVVGGCGQRAESAGVHSSTAEREGKSGGAKSVRFAVTPDCETGDSGEGVSGEGVSNQLRDTEEREQEDGSRLTVCANGTRKLVSRDGKAVSLSFANGDTKHIRPDGTVVYFYCQSHTTHITHPDGLEELHFPNHQIEKVFPDGRREVKFPDGTIRRVHSSGAEESVFADGTVQILMADGSREIQYSNGQREIHTKEYKRREYPDGTVKTVYPDGRQETSYASGRIRLKDASGKIVLDSCQDTHTHS